MSIKRLPKNFLKKAIAKIQGTLPKGYYIEPEFNSDDSWVIAKVHLKGTPSIIAKIGTKEIPVIFLSNESEMELVEKIADKLKIGDIDIARRKPS
jgi:hypothetical protein